MRGKPLDGTKNPGGRPPKAGTGITREQIESKIYKMAAMSLSADEIASVLGVTKDALYKSYSIALKSGHEECNASLRRKQFQVAMKGNTGMLIWLGKQRLGQKDKQEIGGPDGKPIPISYAGAQAALGDFLASVAQRKPDGSAESVN